MYKFILIASLLFISFSTFATKAVWFKVDQKSFTPRVYNDMICQYKYGVDNANDTVFFWTTSSSYNVVSKDEAFFDYFRASINVNAGEHVYTYENKNFRPDENYKPLKYKNFFRFAIPAIAKEDGSELYGFSNLIIGKVPTRGTRSDYIEGLDRHDWVFEGRLDVSYNDHHGNYVPVKCTAYSIDKK